MAKCSCDIVRGVLLILIVGRGCLLVGSDFGWEDELGAEVANEPDDKETGNLRAVWMVFLCPGVRCC